MWAGLNEYISGVICFEETLFHKTTDGRPFTELLLSQGIIPGIKVDKGVVPIAGTDKETVTQVCVCVRACARRGRAPGHSRMRVFSCPCCCGHCADSPFCPRARDM